MTKTNDIPVSAKGIVFEGDAVWLRKNERNEWELPGGRVEQGERSEEAVERELREELGFKAKAKNPVQVHLYHRTKNGRRTGGVRVVSFLCELLGKPGTFEFNGEAGKASFKLFPIKELSDLKMPRFYKMAITKAFAMSRPNKKSPS
jgi:8-oxo-dGTP pyrophosphatase MutT (NUDIX family)